MHSCGRARIRRGNGGSALGSRERGSRPARTAVLLAWLALVAVPRLILAQPTATLERGGRVTAVTVYDGWASVTREVPVEVGAGVYEVRVTNLPRAIEPSSLRAAVLEGDASIARVQFEAREDEERHRIDLDALAAPLADLEGQLAVCDEQLQVLDKEEELLDALAESAATNAGGGTEIDLEEITRVSKYLAEQRTDLLARRRGVLDRKAAVQAQLDELQGRRAASEAQGPPLARSALVGLTVGERGGGPIRLEVNYLVSNVRARPAYNVRTPYDGDRATFEYDVRVAQDSGEDWSDVALIYSTEPVVAGPRPPDLDPVYLGPPDGREAPPGDQQGLRRPGSDRPLSIDRDGLLDAVGQGEALTIAALGPAPYTSYRLSDPVTILARADGEGQALRIATWEAYPHFRYVAAPTVSNHAFLRGSVENTSRLHLLPGPVSVFLGNDYVGDTSMRYVAPGGWFDLFFGGDRRVTVQKVVLDRRTRTTGLLGDGRETVVRYRLRATNETGRSVPFELWDRTPLSVDERVSVSITRITPDLSEDDAYRTRERRRGLLKWELRLEPHHRPGQELTAEYTLVVSHKEDVPTPSIPD